MENLIHLTFDTEGAARLKESFGLDDIIAGDICVLEDDLAFGPLQDGTEGPDREGWWKGLTGGEAYGKAAADAQRLEDLCQKMRTDGNSEIWIWAAQNARDVCGYYALLEPLSPFTGRVHLIYLNNLPFINEKGSLFYPTHLAQIMPREFLKARKLAREITPAEIEVDTEEWTRLVAENANVRVLEGGKKISGRADDYFDGALTVRCRTGYVKGWRLVSQVAQKSADHTQEDFLLGRLSFLLESGTLEAKEGFRNLRDAELKTPGGPAEEPAAEASGDTDNTDKNGHEQD
jgi:hypothetical protein